MWRLSWYGQGQLCCCCCWEWWPACVCAAPAQVKARLWGGVGGVMGMTEEKAVYVPRDTHRPRPGCGWEGS